uniref:Uncharacterized protein n=1 Tax=Magnetococcus massalia (strain MO-1) TaxID=451514 RepID=A0A1S7LC27_MAGMO|nr:Conserved protein of unknown function [Candidatus Magnetococcus massalia]
MSRDKDSNRTRKIHREVSKLFNQALEPDPFSLHRLRKEAEQLATEEPIATSLILARISCMEHQPGAMETFYKQLINQNPAHPQTHLEYGLSLRKLGFYSEARERTRKAMELDGDHPGVIQQMIRDCILSGRFNEAGDFLKQAVRASLPIYRAQFHFLESVQDLLNQHKVVDDEIEMMQQCAVDLLREHHLYPSGILRAPAVHIELTTDGEEPVSDTFGGTPSHAWLRWRIHLHQPIERVESLNTLLAQRLASQEQLPATLPQQVDMAYALWREGVINMPFGFYM